MDASQFLDRLISAIADRVADRLVPPSGASPAIAAQAMRALERGSPRPALPPTTQNGRRRSVPELQILAFIAKADNPLSMREIQKLSGLSQVTANKKVNRLREEGSVKRVQEGCTIRYLATAKGVKAVADTALPALPAAK